MQLKRTEALEWVRRYRTKARTDGANEANQWWRQTIADIERIRGSDRANELRFLMNQMNQTR